MDIVLQILQNNSFSKSMYYFVTSLSTQRKKVYNFDPYVVVCISVYSYMHTHLQYHHRNNVNQHNSNDDNDNNNDKKDSNNTYNNDNNDKYITGQPIAN